MRRTGPYVVQLLPDAVQADILGSALRTWIDNNPNASEDEMNAAYVLLGKLRERDDR